MVGSRSRGLLAAALILVAVMSLTLGSALDTSAHVRTFKSSLSIRYNENRDLFRGDLKTGKPCRRNRVVSVYLARPGPDRLVGSDLTNRRAKFVVENPKGLTGRFYARITRVTRGVGYYVHQHRCKGSRSVIIEVVEA